ncbi:S8 family serine peptidase [uncultured Lactobacillus sp.]|uniref:S8 family serine peptidase n=1 Tax=uncultured Lactobacillus sp. TaxID=153152 RepID=UPI002805451D|nr:S8 family serine peptidase [uncultured Lactobacillus sp.]
MKKYDLSKNYGDYSYVFKTQECLNSVENLYRSEQAAKSRKKWVAAATIALAAGSTVLLSQGPAVQAATNDPSSAVQVNVVKDQQNNTQIDQTTQENQNTVATGNEQNVAGSNTTDSSTQAETTTAVANQNTAQTLAKSNLADSSPDTNDQSQVQPPANEADHIKGNVKAAWEQGYEGQNTVVAVIDSGADPTHKDFQTMPSNPKLSKSDMEKKIASQGYGKYVNEKFPYVYNYADRDNDYITSDDTNPNDSPHGQHVSGIIAADGQPDGDKTYVVGVAPQAQLMQLRVFGQFSDEKTDDVAKAIYDATNLGADVIQMSLGQGVADQQLTNIEQKAVQYAIDHGVFVSISASNNGNSASVDNPSNITSDDYQSGSNAGNYEPLNSGTVANPGASKNALTVAAETSDTGSDSDMAYFSSWGPLSDYTLKPDLSAPGYNVVSTINHDQYETMSGTSMAGPFAAGSAALVIQRLKETNPELKGADLVAATKAILMNTATLQTQHGYTTPVSPRRQGAGQIDVGAATASPVYVTGDDGIASLSLKQVGDKTGFDLVFHNLSDQSQTYTFDDFGGGYTEQRDADSGVFHNVQLAGARVNGETSVTLAPKETKKVAYTLDLTGLSKNQLVEGWLQFTNSTNQSKLSVPYLAYYGDLTNEKVFDKNANESNPDIEGNRLVNEDNYPRGIADQESLKELVNIDGNYNWQEVAKLYESGKVAFSPNSDNKSDLLKPYTYLKQNVKDLKVEILDAKGNVVRVVSDVQGVDKSYDEDGVTKDTSLSVSMRDNPDAFEWDGKVYDASTGKMVTAKDGQYTYRMVATLWNSGSDQTQTADFPVIVDTTAPTVSALSYNDANHTLSGTYTDTGAGFTDYSYATVQVNDKVFGYKLNEDQSGFDDNNKTKGHFSFVLGDDALAALSGAENKVSVALSDVADNTTVVTTNVAGVSGKPAISVWNATDRTAFDKNAADYDKATNTYILRGSADKDFYLNGALVQVHNGQYEAPVKDGTTNLIFSSDAAGNNVLKELATITPKVFFEWQNVDGFQGNFGVKIYSVGTNDPNDAVVQAAVPKGKNVKAYAADYFTGEIYEGTVQDGVATFHVHTSINANAEGVFRRALLTGWAEVDGPAYNDKQITDQSGVANTNHIGVYYEPDSATRTVYTDRDQLGNDVADSAADESSFGPGAYPGHAPSDLTTRTDPNPDIHFDYMNDNDTTRLGQNAVSLGYYDAATKKFTVTGHVADDVVALTVLGDNSNEAAAENQVKLGSDGKFSFSFTAEPTGQRPLAYIYTTKSGEKVRGTLNLILDTTAPTLNVDQVDGNNLDIWTNNPTFNLSGTVNDNLDGYRLYVNGNNIYREFENSGYNRVVGLNSETSDVNPYGPHKFEETLNLNDNNGNPTTHIFTVEVVDQAGNTVEKQLTVHFDPNYVAPVVPEPSESTDNTLVTTTNNNDDNEVLTGKTYQLLHNAYIYNSNAEVVLTVDTTKSSVLNKGTTISALENGHVYTIKGKRFYRIGDNEFVKVANTVLQGVKRLQVKHNAYVYDENGQVLKQQGKSVLLKKGRWIATLNNADTFEIQGKIYYKLADGQFVKVRNTQK